MNLVVFQFHVFMLKLALKTNDNKTELEGVSNTHHLMQVCSMLDFYEFLVTKVISGQAAERPKGVARKAEAFGWVLTDSQEKL